MLVNECTAHAKGHLRNVFFQHKKRPHVVKNTHNFCCSEESTERIDSAQEAHANRWKETLQKSEANEWTLEANIGRQ